MTKTAALSDHPSPLFQPFRLDGLALPNRVVMAPMSRYFCPDEVPHQGVADYYARRAQHGVGLIITEATYIPHPSAHSYAAVPRFYGEDALAGWRKVVEAVHAAGGKIMPQLWHTGSFRELGMAPDPSVPGFGPSENLNAFENTAHVTKPMSEADIAEVIAAYARAAASAKALGFDGVELHGAHGYLIDSFFWGETNRRTDAYGGDLPARARFGAEVVKAVRASVGAAFPISFRWSQFKQQDYKARLAETPQALAPFLETLTDAGVSIFHASTRRYGDAAFRDLSPLTLAGWTRKITGKPVIAVGSVGLGGVASTAKRPPSEISSGSLSFADAGLAGVEGVEALLDAGEFDLIAVGRALLADPAWAEKVRDGRLDERRPFEKAHLETLA